MSHAAFITCNIISSQRCLFFYVLSHLAFITFVLMSFRHYLQFNILSFRCFLLFDNFSLDLLSHLTFFLLMFFTVGVLYFDILLVNHIWLGPRGGNQSF
jgi:hypothetical protein